MSKDVTVQSNAAKCFFCLGKLQLLAIIASNLLNSETAPAAPVATEAINANASQFDSHWNSSMGATGYFLDVSTSNTFASFVAGYNNLSVGNVTTITVTGLSADTDYFYRVRASNSAGTSASSNTISLHTDLTVLPGDFALGVTITSAMSWIQGLGATDGAQNIQPERPITIGTHLIPVTLTDIGGGTMIMNMVFGFSESVHEFNLSGVFTGSGCFAVVYESDDAPNVWQSNFGSSGGQTFYTQPTFHQLSTVMIGGGLMPQLTSFTQQNAPAP